MASSMAGSIARSAAHYCAILRNRMSLDLEPTDTRNGETDVVDQQMEWSLSNGHYRSHLFIATRYSNIYYSQHGWQRKIPLRSEAARVQVYPARRGNSQWARWPTLFAAHTLLARTSTFTWIRRLQFMLILGCSEKESLIQWRQYCVSRARRNHTLL